MLSMYIRTRRKNWITTTKTHLSKSISIDATSLHKKYTVPSSFEVYLFISLSVWMQEKSGPEIDWFLFYWVGGAAIKDRGKK